MRGNRAARAHECQACKIFVKTRVQSIPCVRLPGRHGFGEGGRQHSPYRSARSSRQIHRSRILE